MFVSKTLGCILLQLCLIVVCNAEVDYFDVMSRPQDNYVDPHSFYYDKHTKTENPPVERNDNHEVGEWKGCGNVAACYRQLHKCRSSKNTDVADELFSRRFVNMLVSRTKFEKNGLHLIGQVELELTETQLEVLKKFGLGKRTVREADVILNEAIQTPPWDPIHESTQWIRNTAEYAWEKIYDCLWLHHMKFALLLVFAYLHYLLRGSRYNFWILTTFGVQLILVGSFFMTWWRLIQEERIKFMVAEMKHMDKCRPHNMSWYNYFRSWFAPDECDKYVEAMMREPLLQISPLHALAHMFSGVMYVPVEMGGKIVGSFLRDVTAHMPWWLSTLVQLTVCLGFFPFLIVLIIILVGGSANFGFGPLNIFSLAGPGQRPAIRNAETVTTTARREPIEIILNVSSCQHATGSTNAITRPYIPAITSCEGCSKKDTKEEVKNTQVAAGGDAESNDRPGPSGESAEEETVVRIHKRNIQEVGSGDCH